MRIDFSRDAYSLSKKANRHNGVIVFFLREIICLMTVEKYPYNELFYLNLTVDKAIPLCNRPGTVL